MKMTYLPGRICLDEELRSMKQPIFVYNVMKQSFYINTNGHTPPVHNCVPFDPSSGEISDLGIITMYELSRGKKDTFFIKIEHPEFTTYIPSNA